MIVWLGPTGFSQEAKVPDGMEHCDRHGMTFVSSNEAVYTIGRSDR